MIAASYYDGRSSRRHEAKLIIDNGELRLEGAFGVRTERLSTVEISEPGSDALRTLRFADGASCEIRDGAALDAALSKAGWRHSPVVALQGRWHWALVSFAATVAAVAALYVWALPWFAELMAPRVPDGFTSTVSEQALNNLDTHVLGPSALTPLRQQELTVLLDKFDRQSGSLPRHRLLFRSAPMVGPNAFALPNGDLVLFDQLVALSKDDMEIVAVLAHELGHVQNHHGMRQLIQGAVVSFVAGIWFGDVSSVAAGLGALVLESRYSRDFEREADAYAVARLTASGNSPELLAVMLGRLEQTHAQRHGGKSDSGQHVAELLSTHPDSEERIAEIRKHSMHPR